MHPLQSVLICLSPTEPCAGKPCWWQLRQWRTCPDHASARSEQRNCVHSVCTMQKIEMINALFSPWLLIAWWCRQCGYRHWHSLWCHLVVAVNILTLICARRCFCIIYSSFLCFSPFSLQGLLRHLHIRMKSGPDKEHLTHRRRGLWWPAVRVWGKECGKRLPSTEAQNSIQLHTTNAYL